MKPAQTAALRHFYCPAPLVAGGHVALPAPLAHRLAKVLRLGGGDTVALFNGHDGLWEAVLEGKGCAAVQLLRQVAPQPAPAGLVLALGLPKREAWEAALRQATEMGVAVVQPLATEYAQRGSFNAARAETLVIEAAEQTERLTLPTVRPVLPFKVWLQGLAQPCLWAHARGQAGAVPSGCAVVLVGPEGGFSPAEEAALAAHPAVRPVRLPTGVLRTDTAVVALLAAALLA